MMRIDILTLFPDYVDFILSESIIGRARRAGKLDVRAHNIRDWSEDKHRRVDDAPYGGGRGMLMAAPPIYRAWKAVTEDFPDPGAVRRRTVYLSPRGTVFRQEKAKELSRLDQLVLICGHYEGVDERLIEEIVDEELSVGDFVLTGGELPACLVADAVGRLCDGVLTLPECHEKESFEDNLLEYPQYTRPPVWHGREVPAVLLSGHHANIEKWRREAAERITRERRPDLYDDVSPTPET